MANSALIEDLRKQFAENPRRVFARLANEYRKSGDLDAAIEICRAHVPLQPTYISGYIVLGQALFERGQPDEARSTFETALTLDPENLIALRQLGDIARASGDLESARGWYHKLLEVDPQNEEIAAQLDALEPPSHSESALADESPVSWSDIHPDSEVTPLSPQATQPSRPRFTIGVIPENLEAEASVPRPSAPAQASQSSENASPVTAAKDEEESSEPVVEKSAGSPKLPESFGGFDRHSPTPPMSMPAVHAESNTGEMTFEPSEMTADSGEASAPELMDISDLAPAHDEATIGDLPPINTTAEFSISEMPTSPEIHATPSSQPATAAELASLFGDRDMETASAPGSDGERTFEEEVYDPTVGRMLDLSNRTSSDALLPDLMMTESGAELLREQGHIEQAIYVYRHLAAKNPQDTSYAERIAALERGAHSSIPLIASISEEVISAARKRPGSAKSIRAFFSSFASRRPAGVEGERTEKSEPSSEPAAAVAPPEEAQIAAADAAPVVASAAPPEAAPVAEPQPPTTVSDDDRSALETLFSGKPTVAETDERAAAALASAFSEEFAPEPTGPAGQPTRAASEALSLDAVFQNTRARSEGEARAGQSNVSFDEFFANRENGGGSANGKSDGSVQTASLVEDSQSDLELFHEWLDGLKK